MSLTQGIIWLFSGMSCCSNNLSVSVSRGTSGGSGSCIGPGLTCSSSSCSISIISGECDGVTLAGCAGGLEYKEIKGIN